MEKKRWLEFVLQGRNWDILTTGATTGRTLFSKARLHVRTSGNSLLGLRLVQLIRVLSEEKRGEGRGAV